MTTHTKIQIRFNDIDLAGHVHNAIYLSYFEQGRLDFFNRFSWRRLGLEKTRAYFRKKRSGLPKTH
jgi:acyl-CoA thioesterase FadM